MGVGIVPNGMSDAIGTEEKNGTKVTRNENVSWADMIKGVDTISTPGNESSNPVKVKAKE